MCLLTIRTPSLEKCLFKFFASFFSWVIFLFIFELYEFFVYLDTNPLSDSQLILTRVQKHFYGRRMAFQQKVLGATGHPEAPEV